MSKKKDLKAKHPHYTIDVIDVLAENDPSGSNKYLPFMVKLTEEWVEWVRKEMKEDSLKEMFDIVKDFEDLSNRNLLENKDIYSYEDTSDIVEAIKLAKERVTRSEVKKKETITLFEDDKMLVVMPLTSRSSNIYGKATKWCVSSEDHGYKKYFKQYTSNGTLIFVIDKTIKDKEAREEHNKFAKVAFHVDRNENDKLTLWDVRDQQLSMMDMMNYTRSIGDEIMKIVNDKIQSGETNLSLAEEKGVVE